VGAFLLPAAGCGGDAPNERANVVLISIDTLRPDYLGCYGHEGGLSPAIDAFARAGTLFEDVTSASPWTLPSHASMLTGMYPSTHGVATTESGLTETTLATWLGRAGYQTFAVGNALNVSWPAYGVLQGFDEVERIPEIEVPGGPIFNRAEIIVAHGIRMLKGRDAERPFFLFLHFYDVHTDFTPEPLWEAEYVAPYDGPLTGLTSDLTKVRNRILRGQAQLGEADVRYLEQMYAAEIRTFDERLALFLRFLEREGLVDETIVAITSDHGEEFGEHGGLLHGRTHYQELIRIPWLLRGPGVPAQRRVAVPVHLIDVAPTILGLADLPAPPGIDGRDASVAWRDPAAAAELRFLFSEADHNNIVDGKTRNNFKKMVRLGQIVLHYDLRTGKKELYDLATDPGELRDLAADRPADVELLSAKLEEFMQREGSAKDIGEVSEEMRALLDSLGYGGGE